MRFTTHWEGRRSQERATERWEVVRWEEGKEKSIKVKCGVKRGKKRSG